MTVAFQHAKFFTPGFKSCLHWHLRRGMYLTLPSHILPSCQLLCAVTLHDSFSQPAFPQSTLSSSSPPRPSLSTAELIPLHFQSPLGFGSPPHSLLSDFQTRHREVDKSPHLWSFSRRTFASYDASRANKASSQGLSCHFQRQHRIFSLNACIVLDRRPLRACHSRSQHTILERRKRDEGHHGFEYVFCFFFFTLNLIICTRTSPRC